MKVNLENHNFLLNLAFNQKISEAWFQLDIMNFENIITGIHFNNKKKDNQKLKHGGKELK